MGACTTKSKQKEAAKEYWIKSKSELGFYQPKEIPDEDLQQCINYISRKVNPAILLHDQEFETEQGQNIEK